MEVVVGTITIFNLKVEEIVNAGHLADFIGQLSERLAQAEENSLLHDQITLALQRVNGISLSCSNITARIIEILKEHQLEVDYVKR